MRIECIMSVWITIINSTRIVDLRNGDSIPVSCIEWYLSAVDVELTWGRDG